MSQRPTRSALVSAFQIVSGACGKISSTSMDWMLKLTSFMNRFPSKITEFGDPVAPEDAIEAHPVDQRGQPIWPGAVEHVSAFRPFRHQPGQLQRFEMLGDGALGDAASPRQFRDRDFAGLYHPLEHGAPRGIGEGAHDGGDDSVFAHGYKLACTNALVNANLSEWWISPHSGLFGRVSGIQNSTGSTAIPTTAIITPGMIAQPVRSTSNCASQGVSPPKMARGGGGAQRQAAQPPLARKLFGGGDRTHGADAAGDSGEDHRAEQRPRSCEPLAISQNRVTGRTALATPRNTSTGRLPSRSDNMPTSGVTRMTATAAKVDSHSEARSVSDPAEVRKAGT